MPRMAKVQPDQQLQPIDLVAPGSLGLNTTQSGTLLSPQYALIANNCVIDTNGRLGARPGVTPYTSTPITGAYPVKTIFEYNQGNGTYSKIVMWDGGASTNLANPNLNSIAGTASLANGRWWLQNFNNKVIGFQSGQKPAVYSAGSGVLNTIVASSGSVPTSNGVGTAAFGRVWCVGTDNQTIYYSGLLDETDWGSASSGLIDMHTVWVDGTDTIQAIFHFNAALVICGLKHIVMFTDGRGSQLGLDPTQAYVFDVIVGSGCTSQWTVDYIGESDVIFLSPNGVQSIERLITDRSNPLADLTKYVRPTLTAQMAAENMTNVTGVYNQLTGYYLLSLPANQVVYCLDMKRRYTDDTQNVCCRTTTWAMTLTSLWTDHNNITFVARTAGTVATSTGVSDEGSTYNYTWLSPWMNLGDNVAQRVKMLKRMSAVIYTSGGAGIVFSWNVDFGRELGSATLSVPQAGNAAQYGVGQYGVSQYGAGQGLVILKYPARARGQYYQIGISSTVIGGFSVQQCQLATKIGRIA